MNKVNLSSVRVFFHPPLMKEELNGGLFSVFNRGKAVKFLLKTIFVWEENSLTPFDYIRYDVKEKTNT